jgi:cellulose synthase/poly-beta-1,6-N-acetylglucosamine synthase-like glycosyltransferase
VTVFLIMLSIAIFTGIIYTLIISAITRGWFKIKENERDISDTLVSVSVIIPFRDEEKNLPALLECLKKQSYLTGSHEVILVDDHSEDSGQKIIRDFIATHNLKNFILLALQPGEGISKKAALQKGIEYSKGELIITTDADCTMGEYWVLGLVNKYITERCSMISAPVCILPGTSFFSKLQSLEFFSLIGCGAGSIAINKPFLANGANLAFTRNLFNELKGYSRHINYASGDDVFMLLQAKKRHNITFLKNNTVVVYTKGSPDIKTFLNQRIRWASKSTGYKDAAALITALSVFFLNSQIFVLCILGFFNPKFFYIALGLFILKLTVDFMLFFGVSKFFHLSKLMWFYVPMQFFYTLYIIIISILSLLIPFEWKNRRMRK